MCHTSKSMTFPLNPFSARLCKSFIHGNSNHVFEIESKCLM